MATPGTYNYTASASVIINEALQIVGAIGSGGTADSNQQADALRKLNMMIKAWMADDLQVWVAQRATLFPVTDQHIYQIGSASGHDHVASDYYKTELSVAGAATDTTITVDSATNISDGDAIGIILDDATRQWTTVNGAPVGNVVTLTTALTGAAAINNQVYTYPQANLIQRPQNMLEMWRHVDDGTTSGTTGYDIPIFLVTREQYDELPNKSADGLAVQACYEPLLDGGPGSSNGQLQIWPEHSDMTALIQFRYTRPLQNVDAVGNDLDFPQEWYLALAYNLAYLLSANYGVNPQERYLLRKDAMQFKQEVLNYAMEDGSIFLRPDYTADRGF